MPISDEFNVDFSIYDRDVVSEGLNRMLSQHYDKCVLRQFMAVILDEVQELYDACIDMQKQRIVYNAQSINLDALGRIVGADRRPWILDEDFEWFKFNDYSRRRDYEGIFKFDDPDTRFDDAHFWSYGGGTFTYDPVKVQDGKNGFDRAPFWVTGAVRGKYIDVDDEQYRVDVINKAIKNHTLVGSLQEVQSYIKRVTGLDVSFEKVGPNQVRLYVPSNISQTSLLRITRGFTDGRVDDGWYVPYPATLNIVEIVYLPAGGWFIFDREEHGFDQKPMAVLGTGKVSTTVFIFDKAGHGFDKGKMILTQQGAYDG